MRRNTQNHHGYKNHIDVDVKHKLVRSYEVMPACVLDSEVFEDLLDEDNIVETSGRIRRTVRNRNSGS